MEEIGGGAEGVGEFEVKTFSDRPSRLNLSMRRLTRETATEDGDIE